MAYSLPVRTVMDRLRDRLAPWGLMRPSDRPALPAVLTPDAVLEGLRATGGGYRAMAYLGELIGSPWRGGTDTGWSSNLSVMFPLTTLPPGVRAALVAWAVTESDRWVDLLTDEASPIGALQGVWGDPWVWPVLLILDGSDSWPEKLGSLDTRAYTAFAECGELGPQASYSSWRYLGFQTPESLDRLARGVKRLLPSPDVLCSIAAHPAATRAHILRAVQATTNTYQLSGLLMKSGLMRDPAVRAAIRHKWLGATRVAEVYAQSSTPEEFGILVRHLGDTDFCRLIGPVLRQGTPEQLAAVRATTEQWATWCERCDADGRAALIGAMSQAAPIGD